MSLSTLPRTPLPRSRLDAPVLDVVVPVYNEEIDLEPCVRRSARLPRRPSSPTRSGSPSRTTRAPTRPPRWRSRLAYDVPEVASTRLAEKGRGRALTYAWTHSDAAVLAYMDVDLSTDLGALLPLVAPLISGHSDLAIGSRLARGSRVVRGAKREFISRSYNLLLRGTLAARFSDAQCGFKAIRADVAERLLPMVEDTGWFFDTEMLVLAERAGLRIHEVPVDWVDDPDSRVDLVGHRARRPQGHPAADPGARFGPAAAGGGARATRPQRAPGRRSAGRTGRAADPVRRRRAGQHGGLPAVLRDVAERAGAAVRQRDRAADHRGGQHRGQPAADLRRTWHRPGMEAPGAGPGGLRHRPGSDQWLAHAAGRG